MTSTSELSLLLTTVVLTTIGVFSLTSASACVLSRILTAILALMIFNQRKKFVGDRELLRYRGSTSRKSVPAKNEWPWRRTRGPAGSQPERLRPGQIPRTRHRILAAPHQRHPRRTPAPHRKPTNPALIANRERKQKRPRDRNLTVVLVRKRGLEPPRAIRPTRPSTWRVCQFRHLRLRGGDYSRHLVALKRLGVAAFCSSNRDIQARGICRSSGLQRHEKSENRWHPENSPAAWDVISSV